MSNQIEEAVAALRRGDQRIAFDLLRARLAQEPADATAWLWLSEATPDPRRKVEALTRFLEIAPNHAHAATVHLRLQQLQAQVSALPPEERTVTPIEFEPAPPAPVRPAVAEPTPPQEAASVIPDAAVESAVPREPAPVNSPAALPLTRPESDARPSFNPRPAAPPPPNFKPSRAAQESEKMPLWVWLLMLLSLALVALFIYFIMNFEQYAALIS